MACEQFAIYKCECGCTGLVEMILGCKEDCEMSCCGKAMTALPAKTAAQEGKEKHVPVIEKIDGGYRVKIGSVPHPMEPDHFIQFVELRAGKDVLVHFFAPGDAPEAVFKTDAKTVTAREYCNKHGLWRS
ncbi:MAG TPA: desulfoferrodoxin [Phycisphaerales bacterium]|nr:desulfoferrodoxin [Phycisphaerales bacterium]